jgi:hypothetical protein
MTECTRIVGCGRFNGIRPRTEVLALVAEVDIVQPSGIIAIPASHDLLKQFVVRKRG